jgi:uncharacterized protein
MLIEFRVKNFRSFRDELAISLVASKDKTTLDTNATNTGVTAAPNVLRSAAIFGANAGGKSNLVKAIQYMRGVVLESATVIQPGQTFGVQPFRLDKVSGSQPTEFEVTFLVGGIRYQYGFSMTPLRVVDEHLLVYKAFKPQVWFERHYDSDADKDVYEFGSGLKGDKKVWESATRPNALFLSMAVQLNSDTLRPVYDWFLNNLVVVNELSPLAPQFSVQMLQQDKQRKAICDFLTSADISISDIDVIKNKKTGRVVHFELVAGELASGKPDVRTEEIEENQLRFHHVTESGDAVFDLADESSGTRNLLFLAGPVLDILPKGLTLVIDELDASLHTLLVREIVRLFHRPDINTGGAQLIFTTHDTSLLDAYGLFRRDQVWFVEKKKDQSSELYSLLDFNPRKHEALGRRYLQGRYGSIPLLRQMVGGAPDGA